MHRPIIKIDEQRCDGCGQCVLDCAEGALAIMDGKARLVSESFCDGLGACLHCPQEALSVVVREAEAFDEAAVKAARQDNRNNTAGGQRVCRGSSLFAKPALSTWPIQLRLLPPSAPFLKGAKLLLAAHCAGFSCPDLHENWLPERTLIIACPKLEPKAELLGKLADILRENTLRSMEIMRMSVPCCGALERLVNDAMVQCGANIPCQVHTLAIP